MEKSEIEYLVKRYARNECTRAEWQQLLSVIEAGEQEATLQAALQAVWTDTHAGELPAGMDKEVLYAQLQPLIVPPLVIKSRKPWIAAAAVIAGLLVATYVTRQWLFPSRQPVAVVVQQDLPPGHTGAVLTLVNGRQIVLDSAGNGMLATQGNTRVMNQHGQLVYKPGGLAATMDYNIVTTPRARQYQLVLPDGTKVWLNAASSIRYPVAFGRTARKVEITGEAYFEVARQAGVPFTVTTRNMEVDVLGTHFNVNAYDDETSIKTTLTEGAVKISAAGNKLQLAPGQQSSVSATGIASLVKNADVESALAWKNGLFRYNGARLDFIMRQVARWYNVDIVFKDKIDEEFVVTIPRDVPLSQVLELLEATGHVHFSMNNNIITVEK